VNERNINTTLSVQSCIPYAQDWSAGSYQGACNGNQNMKTIYALYKQADSHFDKP